MYPVTLICVLDVSPLPGMDCPHCLQGLAPVPTFWSFPVLALWAFLYTAGLIVGLCPAQYGAGDLGTLVKLPSCS